MPKLLNGSKWDLNLGSLDCESSILSLSYCAPVILTIFPILAVTRTTSKRTVVEIEEEAAHVLVIDLATAVRLVLGDNLK